MQRFLSKTAINSINQEHSDLQLSKLPNALLENARKAASQQVYRRSENTIKSYSSAWNNFTQFCQIHGFNSLPAIPEVVLAYLGQEMTRLHIGNFNGEPSARQLSNSAISIRVAAIRHFHIEHGFNTPTNHPEIIKSLEGFRRNHYRQLMYDEKKPLLNNELEKIINVIKSESRQLIKHRDLALLTLLRAGGFRRSEIVKLTTDSLFFRGDALVVTMRFTKTNQAGKSEIKILPNDESFAPYHYVEDWLQVSGITQGPIFRSLATNGLSLKQNNKNEFPAISAADVNRILKKYLKKAGLDERQFGAHSARSGIVTQMGIDNVGIMKIQSRTGHKDLRMLATYNK
ncbi:tyrosine-type recombinase/integrase [Parashewanella tropica]|uniref:tyrosine-type recombinase/integrase n=1 Tax=Parashewanella tropica TaxID=2547970 RepID=UPI0010598CC7|nr:tyrosine-type recombinase/integrase [Parashewanella tropica]